MIGSWKKKMTTPTDLLQVCRPSLAYFLTILALSVSMTNPIIHIFAHYLACLSMIKDYSAHRETVQEVEDYRASDRMLVTPTFHTAVG